MDRPRGATAGPQIADQVVLHPEQIRAAATDLLDRLVEPALVSFRRLVPGRSVGLVHRAVVAGLGRARRADVRRRVGVAHPPESSRAATIGGMPDHPPVSRSTTSTP